MESISAHTLSNFRATHAEELNELFVQTLGLLSADGLITLERVMLDGTKIRANASGNSFRSQARVEEYPREVVEALEAQTEEESSRQMQAAQQRAKREREEHESALKEYDKLKAAKSRVGLPMRG